MNWKFKAFVQNVIALLPSNFAQPLYYTLQRKFGSLDSNDSLEHLGKSVAFVKKIISMGGGISGKSVFELGTGRRLSVPVLCWLYGAEKIRTTDLNRYLRYELVAQDVQAIRERKTEFLGLLGDSVRIPGFNERLEKLLSWNGGTIESLLSLINTQYVAGRKEIGSQDKETRFDYHVSQCVLEHIPPLGLHQILREAAVLLKSDGKLVHLIDMTDHFSHSDPNISSLNFLRYKDLTWKVLSGNTFMYQNRLRIDDYIALFESAGLKIDKLEPSTDESALKIVESEGGIAKRFLGKSAEVNATLTAWILASPRNQGAEDLRSAS